MIDLLTSLRQGHVALLGLGVENRALARFLARHRIRFSVCDARAPEDRLALDAELSPWIRAWFLGPGYLEDLGRFDVLFRTPGLRPDHAALQDAVRAGARVSSQTRLFAALSPARVVGITGTKGKGTTASLLNAMLQAEGGAPTWLGGNIGVPPISWLEDLREDHRVLLELSSFQLADWECSPWGGIVLGVGEDHLDYHGTRTAYVAAKRRIAAFQGGGDWLVVDDDSPTAASMAEHSKATVLRFSLEHEVRTGAWVHAGQLDVRGPGGEAEKVCDVVAIRLRGRHNWRNVAAAAAAGCMLGVRTPAMRAAICSFRGLPHRLQQVARRRGVTYYDDSLATTPEAAAAAVTAFREPVVLIAGGSSKGADFAPLAHAVQAASLVRAVVLVGAEAPRVEVALRAEGWRAGRVLDGGDSMASAVAVAARWARPGDVVLLAPGCASFDMFRDYRQRGELFAAAVADLPAAPETRIGERPAPDMSSTQRTLGHE